MTDDKFTWVKTHEQLTQYLSTKENNQLELIDLLKSVGIGPFNDQSTPGEHDMELNEIDPFTFFCYIYKYGSKNRLKYLQAIANKLQIYIPKDDSGIPSAQAQKVWLFPYKYARINNQVSKLWSFFRKARANELNDIDFEEVLKIKGTGKTKLTEALFYINPIKYLPVNGPTKPYLEEELGIKPAFNTYSDYLSLLDEIKTITDLPFYELSFNAWNWLHQRKKINYWVFQGNPKVFDFETALKENLLGDWTVSSHKDKIKRGDKLILWITGDKSGCYALAEITSEPYAENALSNAQLWKNQEKRNLKSDIEITHNLVNHPIYKSTIEGHKKLKDLKVGYQGTNFMATKNEYEALLDLVNEDHSEIEKMTTAYPLNTIFYGPPGTGKTYNTILRAAEIINKRTIEDYEEARKIFKEHLHNRIEFITFHQNYSYEDFIQGLRPDVENEKELTFERRDGIFKVIADKALSNLKTSRQPDLAKQNFETVFQDFISPLSEEETEEIEVKMKATSYYITHVTNRSIEFRKNKGDSQHKLSIATLKNMYEKGVNDIIVGGLQPYYNPLLNKLLKLGGNQVESVEEENYVIIIDEINRANISRVLGELITLIEPDKRYGGELEMEIKLPSGDIFTVPSNLYIIGTMNTADKSIALLDIALRRRFEFEAMYPNYDLEGIYDKDILQKINAQIIATKGHDFQIGHAYFMGDDGDLVKRMNKKVIPLLLEYYMNDINEVKNILKKANLEINANSYPLTIKGKRD